MILPCYGIEYLVGRGAERAILALKKEDVNFQNNKISITKTYYRTERRDIKITLNKRLINMEDLEAGEINGLWYPYISYGKLTIVQGDPGEGKTTFILHLATLLTKGKALPCEETAEDRNGKLRSR